MKPIRTDLIQLFTRPIVKKYTNCVCLAMRNPFAGIYLGAWRDTSVFKAIKESKPVSTRRDGDILIWHSGRQYHFGVVCGGGDPKKNPVFVVMQFGRGGPIYYMPYDTALEVCGETYRNPPIRVRSFELPLRHSYRSEEYSRALKLLENKDWDLIEYNFKFFDKTIKDDIVNIELDKETKKRNFPIKKWLSGKEGVHDVRTLSAIKAAAG